MVSAIYRRLRDEQGIWGILTMSVTAGILLALLALGLDIAAISGAKTTTQAALGAALTAAAHELEPASVASSGLRLSTSAATSAFDASLRADIPTPLIVHQVLGPTITVGPPPTLSARVTVFVPLPAPAVQVPLSVSEEVAVGWSGR